MRLSSLISLFKLGAPIAFGQMAILAMGMVDLYFVGHLGPVSMGAVAIGGSLFAAFLVLLFGLLAGLDYRIPYALGAGRPKEGAEYFRNGILIAGVGGGISTLACMGLAEWLGVFGIDPDVSRETSPYLRLMAWSLLPSLGYQVVRQYLQARGRAVSGLVVVLFANVLNAAGDYALVWGRWGFEPMGAIGAGWITLLTRVFMAVALGGYLWILDRRHGWGLVDGVRTSWAKVREILRLGAPAGGQMLLEFGMFATATLMAGRLGAVPLAAHQTVLQIASFTFMVPLGISSAAAVLVARALGEGQRERARTTGWMALGASAGVMLTAALTLSLGAEVFIGIFTSDEGVLAVAVPLMWIAVMFQLWDGQQVTGAGVLRGLGDTRTPLLANLVGHWMVGMPVGVTLGFALGYGIFGIWIGLSVGLLVVAVWLVRAWWVA